MENFFLSMCYDTLKVQEVMLTHARNTLPIKDCATIKIHKQNKESFMIHSKFSTTCLTVSKTAATLPV